MALVKGTVIQRLPQVIPQVLAQVIAHTVLNISDHSVTTDSGLLTAPKSFHTDSSSDMNTDGS